MAYNGAVIDIPLTSDVEGFVSEVRKKLNETKNLGLEIDTSKLEEALDSYLDTFKKIANTKLNASSFTKAQETISKEIDNLKKRTDALEAGFAGLISVMENAEGGKFATQLADIKNVMNDLADVTIVTTNAINSMNNTELDTSPLERTYTLLKEIQELSAHGIGNVDVADNFKDAKKELLVLFNNIQKKKIELNGIEVVSDEDKQRVAELQKEISEMALMWKKMYSSSSNNFFDEFTDATVTLGKTQKSFENLSDIIDNIFNSIQDNVSKNIPFIENSLKSVNTIKDLTGGTTVSANLGTTTKGLIDQLQRLLDSVQPYLDENPLEVSVSLATEWGTRRNKELLKQFQSQIDNLSKETDVSVFSKIYEDIQKSFGNQINLKFTSDFDKEERAIRAGVAALKAEVGRKFELNPVLNKDAVTKLQSQLDKLSSKLILSINSVKLTEGAIKDAGTLWADETNKLTVDANDLSSIIDTMVASSEKLNQELAPIWQLLVDIKNVLNQYPIQSILDSSKELVSVIQKAFNILSTEDLDNVFTGLQKRAEAISGSLRLGENQKELKSLLAAYREYQELGGSRSLTELGGNEKVQQWFKRNKDIVLETTQAVEKLNSVEDKTVEDIKDTSAFDILSVKLDDVINKMQGTVESLDKIKSSLKEISDVSSSEKIVSIDTENIEKITNAIGDLQIAIEKIHTSLADGTIFKGFGSLSPTDVENIQKVVGALAEMANVMPSGDFANNIGKIRSFVNTFSKEKGIDRIEKAAEGVNKLREALDGEVSSNSLLLIFQKISESADVSGLLTELKSLLKVETAANQAAIAKKDFSEANKEMKKSAEDSSAAVEKEKAALQQVINKLDGLNQLKFMPDYLQQINDLKDEMSGIDDTATDAIEAYKKLTDTANKLWKERGFSEWKKAAESSIASLEAKIAKFARNNTAMSSDFKRQLDDIRNQIRSTMSIEEVSELTTQFKKLDAAVHDAEQNGASFFDTLRKRASGINAQLIAQYLSFQDFIRYTRQAIDVINDLDYALVDLKKTTTMTSSELSQFYYDSNDVAKQMGVTTEEIIDQAAAWSRLGYSSKEAATEMATLSSQFAQISPGMDVETATDGLVSAMKAFHVDVADVESEIMDVINKTGNTLATTNEEIVDMLERSSSAMSAANNTIKETIALESAAVQITRNAETTGTAFRTISMRIRGFDEETEEYIGNIEELTGKIADLTKTAKTPGGVSLFTDETKETYKSTYQILKDISDIYNDLSDANQAELLETLAGKRGGQVLAGILEDFSEVERAMKNMQEAAGSADAEMSIVEESIAYKINQLEQTWVGIIQELINNGMLGQLIDALTSISEVLGEIITTIGPVPTLVAGLGIRELLLNLDKLPDLIKKIGEGTQLLTEGAGTLTEVLGVISPTLSSLAGTLAPIAPYLLAIAAAAAALYGIYKIWDALTISVDEANEALEDFSEKYTTATSEMEKHRKTVDSLSDSYFELSEGVDSLTGKNISLSDEDYAEFVSTSQTLAEMFPQLIRGVDEYGNYILNLGSNADEAREKLAALLQQEQENYNYELYKDLPDVFENTSVLIEDTTKKLKESQDTVQKFSDALKNNNLLSNISTSQSASLDLTANYDNETTLQYLDEFRAKYLKMIQELKESGNNVLAEDLQNALTDVFDGDTQQRTLSINLASLSSYEKDYLQDYFSQFSKELSSEYQMAVSSANADVAANQKSLQAEWNTLLKNIVGGINFLAEDEQIAEMVTNFANTLPAEFIEELEGQDIQHVIAQWISDAESLSKEDQLKFYDLFNAELTPQERIELYNTLAANLPKGFSIPIHYVIEDDQELIDRVNASINRLSSSNGVAGADYTTKNELQKFFDEMSIDTEEEYNKWLELTGIIDDATEAMEAYRNAVKEAATDSETIFNYNSLSTAVKNMSDKILPQFEALGEAYDAIFNGDEGFTLADVDTSTLEDIRSTFEDLDEDLGIDWDDQTSAVESFLSVIGNVSSTEGEVQKAFNDLATSYFNAAVAAGDFSEENAVVLEQMMSEMGIVNAGDVVAYYTALANAEKIAADNSIDLATATAESIAELVTEGKIAPVVGQALALLAIQKKIAAGVNFSESSNIAELEALANAAGITGQILTDIARAKTLVGLAESGKASAGELSELTALQEKIKDHDYTQDFNIDFSNIGGGSSSSSGAGSEAGDAYVEAFEKELEALEKQRDAGLISESQFLDKYRELIEKYFKDVDGYGEEYAERMADYWDRAIDYMESVVSAIDTLLDKKIDAAEEGKDAAIKALEEEQEAAENNYQEQIDYIDTLIDALEDEKDALQNQIDVLNDQIDAINDANTAREHSMALQKAQYELERAMSQRTRLVYTGEVGQMRYENDSSAVRSAQEDKNDAEDQLAIDALEKQIKLLEEQQELIDKQIQQYQDQQDALQKMLDSSNEYYESLIEQTETYWDTLIESLENQKSKWDELIEQKELAEAFALVQENMRALGFTVEDVLNDTPGAFEAFRDAYLNALSESNAGNQDFIDGLAFASNSAKGAFDEISSSAEEIGTALGKVSDATAPLATAADNVKAVGTAAQGASTGIDALKSSADGISSTISSLDSASFENLEQAISTAKTELENIRNLLVGEDGSIQYALKQLNDANVLAQLGQAFSDLEESISNVATALGVGTGTGTAADAASSQNASQETDTGTSAGSGLSSAIEEIKTAADTFIGASVDDEGETAIGRFNLLKTTITSLVNDVIGNTELEGTLLGSINSIPDISDKALNGDEGAINMFYSFAESLQACAVAASSLVDSINKLSGAKLPSISGGIPSANYTGTAVYTGDWSVGKNEKALVGELGPETILRNGKYTIVGKNGPEFVNLNKDDIVLNHLQTQEVLDKKNQVRALADGSVLTPISNAMRDTYSKLKGITSEMLPSVGNIREIIDKQTKEIQSSISNVSKVSTNPNITITNPKFTVTGVTGEEVMRKIEGSFEGLIVNAYQKAMSD